MAEIDFYEPAINIVDSENAASQQTGEQVDSIAILNELLLLRIDRATIHNGEIHFQNFDFDPPMDVFLTNLQVDALNLTNS